MNIPRTGNRQVAKWRKSHLFSLGETYVSMCFQCNRKSAKHTYLLSCFDTFGGSESQEIENPPEMLPFKVKRMHFRRVLRNH